MISGVFELSLRSMISQTVGVEVSPTSVVSIGTIKVMEPVIRPPMSSTQARLA